MYRPGSLMLCKRPASMCVCFYVSQSRLNLWRRYEIRIIVFFSLCSCIAYFIGNQLRYYATRLWFSSGSCLAQFWLSSGFALALTQFWFDMPMCIRYHPSIYHHKGSLSQCLLAYQLLDILLYVGCDSASALCNVVHSMVQAQSHCI